MSAQRPPALSPRCASQPSMADLLASCAAANAVSTPPGESADEQQAAPVERAASGRPTHAVRGRPDCDGDVKRDAA